MISISLYEDQSYPFYPVLNLFNKFSFTPSSAYLPFFFAVAEGELLIDPDGYLFKTR